MPEELRPDVAFDGLPRESDASEVLIKLFGGSGKADIIFELLRDKFPFPLFRPNVGDEERGVELGIDPECPETVPNLSSRRYSSVFDKPRNPSQSWLIPCITLKKFSGSFCKHG